MSLDYVGIGYSKTAQHLNVREIKAVKGNYWKNSNVYSVLKRYAKRQVRLKRQSYTSEMNFINMKFINFWKPQLAVFVDSEIWPNMIKNLDKRKIPIIILNARITKKSFNNWKIFPKFANQVFKMITLALPQNLESKKFLKKLGVQNIKSAGNIKFYGENNLNKNKNLFLKKKFKNFKVWCAASTHNGEEILVSKLHKNIKKFKKNLLTIIIPRHKLIVFLKLSRCK